MPAGVGLGEGDGHAVLGGGEVEDGLVGLDRGVGEQRQGHRIAGPGRDPHLVVEDELGEIDVILECGDDHPGQSPAAANQHGQDQVMGARAGPGHVLHGRGELGCVGFGDPDRQQPVVAVGFGQHQQRTVPVGVDAESGYLHVDHRVSHPLAVSWHARAVIGGAVPVWACVAGMLLLFPPGGDPSLAGHSHSSRTWQGASELESCHHPDRTRRR